MKSRATEQSFVLFLKSGDCAKSVVNDAYEVVSYTDLKAYGEGG